MAAGTEPVDIVVGVQNALSFEGGGVVAASYSADDMEGEKNERICRGCTRLPVHDGRSPSWALQQDKVALRAPAGRYTQRGPAGGQSLRRDDVSGSRTDVKFGQEHLRNQQPRHSYARD